MKLHTFIAESAGQAVEQIRRQLGPDAVVLNVRKLPAGGLARFLQKPRIEVLAGAAEPAPASALPAALDQLRNEVSELKQQLETRAPLARHTMVATQVEPPVASLAAAPLAAGGSDFGPGWPVPGMPVERELSRLAAVLASGGLLPLHAHRVLAEIRRQFAGEAGTPLARQLALARRALIRLWPQREHPGGHFHVFVGPPGAGKTTVLCKWLAQTVLLEQRPARVWRLDTETANTAESLNIFAEILGVPVERAANVDGVDPVETTFVDLPGANSSSPTALSALARRLQEFAGAQTHLVLNIGYEGQLLQEQARAFRILSPSDAILTHCDEEMRWGKFWNFVLGTNYTVRFLSAGQNLPGDFRQPDPERLLASFSR